ncbi:hypothetical protein OFC46_28000, partial [Escherichia coli]|nr:hypothetical protein [Escherichia coli]
MRSGGWVGIWVKWGCFLGGIVCEVILVVLNTIHYITVNGMEGYLKRTVEVVVGGLVRWMDGWREVDDGMKMMRT